MKATASRWFTTAEMAATLSATIEQIRRVVDDLARQNRLQIMRPGGRYRLVAEQDLSVVRDELRRRGLSAPTPTPAA